VSILTFLELSDKMTDCTNFASQCLCAGGFKMNNDWYFGKAEGLASHIHGLFSHTGTWDYGWTKSWSVVVDNYNYFRSEEYAMYEVSIGRDESIEEAISKYDIRMGDLIYFCKEKGPTHTAIYPVCRKMRFFMLVIPNQDGTRNYQKHLTKMKIIQMSSLFA